MGRILAVTNTLQKLDSPVSDRKMQKLLKKTEESEILNFIENYDIILPEKFSFNCNIVQQYCDSSHPLEDFEAAIKIIKENYPEYIEATEKYLNGNSGYYCLNFLMRKDLYIKCISWIFDILFKLEEERKEIWVNYTEYCNIRTPAYIAERIINIWLIHNIEHYNLKVKETRNIFLETEEVFLQHKPKTFKYFLKRFRLMLKYYLIDIHLRNTENVYSIKFIQNELLETLAYYRNN